MDSQTEKNPEQKLLVLDETTHQGIEQFSETTLRPEVLKALDSAGWKEPTPVQKLCLPTPYEAAMSWLRPDGDW